MAWSRAEALRHVEAPCKEIGRQWADDLRVDYFTAWTVDLHSQERRYQAVQFIDLSSPEWMLEQSEDDVYWTLSLHQAWTAMKWRNWWLNERHKHAPTYRVYTSSIAKHLRNEFERLGIISENVQKLDREALLMFMFLVSGEIVAGWRVRRGRALPDGLQVALVFLIQSCAVWHDEQLDGPRSIADPPGGKYFLCRFIEDAIFDDLDRSRNEIEDGTPHTWDDFDIYEAITHAVESLVLHLEQRAAKQAVEQAEQERREALELLAINPPSELIEWQAVYPHPEPTPYGLSHEGAERWVRDWMLHMGAVGAECTQYVADGGIDVSSDRFIAQVKHYSGTVPVAAIREFLGVAYADELERMPLFFTTGAYPEGALTLSERKPIALFHFDPGASIVTPHNILAEEYAALGFLRDYW